MGGDTLSSASSGNYGIDYNPDFPLQSYSYYLVDQNYTEKNMVTVAHSADGKQKFLIYGGYDTIPPNHIDWFPFNLMDD